MFLTLYMVYSYHVSFQTGGRTSGRQSHGDNGFHVGFQADTAGDTTGSHRGETQRLEDIDPTGEGPPAPPETRRGNRGMLQWTSATGKPHRGNNKWHVYGGEIGKRYLCNIFKIKNWYYMSSWLFDMCILKFEYVLQCVYFICMLLCYRRCHIEW